jgi:hypothetical protein
VNFKIQGEVLYILAVAIILTSLCTMAAYISGIREGRREMTNYYHKEVNRLASAVSNQLAKQYLIETKGCSICHR